MKLVIEIELGNVDMRSAGDVLERLPLDIVRSLAHAVADPLVVGDGGAVMDANGNTVGSWRCLSDVVDPVVDWEADYDAYEAARIYRGSFPLTWLGPGEHVQSVGDGSGACEIVSADGAIRRVNVGDRVTHDRPSE